MRLFLSSLYIFIAVLILACGGSGEVHTFYYFCESRAIETEEGGKETILLTKVLEVTSSLDYLEERSRQWEVRVDSLCANEKGCTDDLHYFTSIEMARTQQMSIVIQSYGDPSQVEVKEVEF